MTHRLSLASRAAAAVTGGYAVAALSTVVLSRALPLAAADAVVAATMVSS